MTKEKLQDPNEYIKMQPATVARVYDMSRSAVKNLLTKMENSEFRDGVTRLSHNMVLIDRARFEMFLQANNGKYLRG